MPPPLPAPAGPAPSTQFPGLATLHDEFMRRLADQTDVAAKVDTTSGVLVALLGAAAGLATAGGSNILGASLHAQTILVAILVVSLLCALLSLWPRVWLKPPDPGDFATYVLWTQDQANLNVLESLYAAIVINGETIARKVTWLRRSFQLLVVAGVVFGVAVVSHIEHVLGN